MRPYETMLRRYRETARGLRGCFPRSSLPSSSPLPSPTTTRWSLSPVGVEGLASGVALSAQAGVTPRHGRVSVSREKQWPVTRRKLRETRRQPSTMFLFPLFFLFRFSPAVRARCRAARSALSGGKIIPPAMENTR